MKRIITSTLVGLVALSASTIAAAKAVPFSKIPQSKLDRVGDVGPVPKRVAAGKKSASLVPAMAPKRQRGSSPTAFLAPNKSIAKTYQKEGWANVDESDESQACRTVVAPHMLAGMGIDEYPSEHARSQHVWAESKHAQRVSIVRSERFVRGEGEHATLEVSVAFVDAVSLGAHTVLEQTVALSRVAKGPGGVDVYAARDGDRVQFVVTAADYDDVETAGRHLKMLRMESPGGQGWSSCGFMRSTLQAGPDGQTQRVLTLVPLRVETTERRPPGAPPGVEAIEVSELRARNAAVFLSVSKSESDRQPVVSISFGWEGDTERIPL